MKVRYYAPRKQCRKNYASNFLYYKLVGDKVIVVYKNANYNYITGWENIFSSEGNYLREVKEEELVLLMP